MKKRKKLTNIQSALYNNLKVILYSHHNIMKGSLTNMEIKLIDQLFNNINDHLCLGVNDDEKTNTNF